MPEWRTVAEGQPILRWQMSQPDARLFPGAARPMPDTVTYRFVNGWVATGDLPCREALKAALPGRTVACPEGPFDALAVGFDGRDLDFSRFCHLPTLIARGFRCLVRGAPVRLRLRTCGGVRLWLDGAPVAVFEPFTRNTPAETEVDLPLTGAAQVLTLRLEDLHERDTTCFFSLEVIDGALDTALPGTVDSARLDEAAQVLGSLRTDRVFYSDGQAVRLIADHPPAQDMALVVRGLGPFGRGGLTVDPDTLRDVAVTLPPEGAVTLAGAEGLSAGCLSLKIETQVDGATLTRPLGTTVLRKGAPLTGDWPARQRRVLDLIADSDGFEATVALCRAALGRQSVRMIEACLDTIEARFDCSDFTILPLLWLYRDFADTLPEALRARMKAAFLGYRYWLDEPGNDVMWFWSENHVLCFHTAQLIAGELFPDAVFPTSGRTGAEQAEIARARLTRWFAAIDEDGLCEWNSAAYYPIDLLGLVSLFHMTGFRADAGRVIDRVLMMAALHSLGDVPAGVQGRCYEKELLAGPHTELGSVMALVCGGDFVPGYDRAAGLLALSDYQPPDLAAVAAPRRPLRAAYTQGHGHAGRLTLWKSAEAQLSTTRPPSPGGKGHQAQWLDVQLARHPMARLWINHPGEARPWGERRPSLLAGSAVTPAVAQDGPRALMVYDLRKDWTDLRFAQLFAAPEAFGDVQRAGGWLIFGDCVGVWCSTPLEVMTDGFYRGALWRAHSDQVGFAVVIRQPGEAGFADRLLQTAPSFADGIVTLDELSLDSAGVFQKDGQVLPFAPLSTTPHLAWEGEDLIPWEDGYGPD